MLYRNEIFYVKIVYISIYVHVCQHWDAHIVYAQLHRPQKLKKKRRKDKKHIENLLAYQIKCTIRNKTFRLFFRCNLPEIEIDIDDGK